MDGEASGISQGIVRGNNSGDSGKMEDIDAFRGYSIASRLGKEESTTASLEVLKQMMVCELSGVENGNEKWLVCWSVLDH